MNSSCIFYFFYNNVMDLFRFICWMDADQYLVDMMPLSLLCFCTSLSCFLCCIRWASRWVSLCLYSLFMLVGSRTFLSRFILSLQLCIIVRKKNRLSIFVLISYFQSAFVMLDLLSYFLFCFFFYGSPWRAPAVRTRGKLSSVCSSLVDGKLGSPHALDFLFMLGGYRCLFGQIEPCCPFIKNVEFKFLLDHFTSF